LMMILRCSFFWFQITGCHHAVGLHKILSLLESEDVNICMHPVEVLANLDLVAEGCYKHYLFLIHAC
jgi:hypothetical protein